MARVTVEDCIVKVPNRFELVVLAAQRVRNIIGGAPLTIERKNDKTPVVALREIAEGTIPLEPLWDEVIHGFRHHIELDETEREMADMLSGEQGVTYEVEVQGLLRGGAGDGEGAQDGKSVALELEIDLLVTKD